MPHGGSVAVFSTRCWLLLRPHKCCSRTAACTGTYREQESEREGGRQREREDVRPSHLLRRAAVRQRGSRARRGKDADPGELVCPCLCLPACVPACLPRTSVSLSSSPPFCLSRALSVSASLSPSFPLTSLSSLFGRVRGPGTHNPHVFEWSEQNDPVMGGSSTGNYTVVEAGQESHALMQGTVRNVSFLHAPGYCRITTIFPHGHVEDASAFKDGALQLVVRNGMDTLVGSKYSGFKVAVSSTKAARHHGGHELFGMYPLRTISLSACLLSLCYTKFGQGRYKANFAMGVVHKQGLTSWDTLTIPFKKFSSDWSDYTGECATRDPDGYQHQCCETGTEHICPSVEGLSNINGLSVWAEGVEGDFKLEVLSISAVALGPGEMQ